MKKTLFLLILLLSAVACGGDGDDNESGSEVYICTGSGAYAYHKYSSCSGLNNCRAEIVSISLKQAKKKRSACNICYR